MIRISLFANYKFALDAPLLGACSDRISAKGFSEHVA